MDSHKNESGKVSKKKYFDSQFKKQLAKALKANAGEPENFDKIMANRHLIQYDPAKVVEFTNNIASDVQKQIEQQITDSETKKIFELTKLLDEISPENQKPKELPLVLKLNANNETVVPAKTHFINFDALNKYLYSAVNGSLDNVEMNDETKTVLFNTYKLLMDQVDKDSSQTLEEMKIKICSGNSESFPNVDVLDTLLQSSSINPLNFPFEYLLNGNLPN